MRSSKSRSRSKQNRPRTLGNIINRVFDSSGPEGKVRGTPQQIIEKYLILARDAQLSNDRVAAENFLQHAEHYTRLLGEATREMQAEQDARQQNWQQNGGGNGGQREGNGGGNNGGGGQRDRDNRENREPRGDYRPDQRQQPRPDYQAPSYQAEEPVAPMPAPLAGDTGGVEVIDLSGEDDAGLVETPEARQPRPPRQPVAEPTLFEPAPVAAAPAPAAEAAPAPVQEPRRRRERPARAEPQAEAAAPAAASPAAPVAAEEETARKPGPRRARGPRKPRGEAGDPPEGNGGDGPREAAE